MEPLILEQTKSTPFVRLDPQTHTVEFKGESYPENAAKFFTPIFSWIRDFLASDKDSHVVVEMQMTYFNSSSSKAFMNLFGMFEEAVSTGREVVVNWRYDEENEAVLEAGEEFKEDAPSLAFNLLAISGK